MFFFLQSWDWLIQAASCFLLSWIVCLLVIFKGPQDIPTARSSHTRPTARGGGLGIVLAWLLGLWFLSFNGVAFWDMYVMWWALSFMCLLMGAIGFCDDIKPMSAISRLMLQFLVAAFFLGLGSTIHTFSLPYVGYVSLGFLAIPLSFFWLVGLVNAFNFFDGLNGLCGGTSFIGSLFMALIAWHHGDFFLLEVSVFFAAACLGFLVLNFPKPFVFLGDGGAYFFGAFWGGLTLVYSYPASEVPFWTFPLLFFLPLCDVTLTIIRRYLKKKPIFTPHRDYHMLLLRRLGWSHHKITLLYWGFGFVQGTLAYQLQAASPETHLLYFLPVILMAALFFPWVLKKARHEGLDP